MEILFDEESQAPVIPADTELTLSVIESGCLFVSLNGDCSLIIKYEAGGMEEKIALSGVSMGAELIERPEFPTIRIHIGLDSANGGKQNYEYFFNIESRDEISLIRKLTSQNTLPILLYSAQTDDYKRVRLDKNIREHLKKLIGGIAP